MNSQLNPQDETYAFARMSPEECAEFESYLDEVNALGNDVSEYADEPDPEDCFPYNCHDMSDDADALASAGMGMDEDYHIDSYYEGQTDLGDY